VLGGEGVWAYLIQNTIGECTTRSNGEQVAFQPLAIRVDVEQRRALRVKGQISGLKREFAVEPLTVLSQPQIIVP
jgi:hypothetical protein